MSLVYKFVSRCTAKRMLEKGTVRFTPMPDLNDPGELLLDPAAYEEISREGGRMLRQAGVMESRLNEILAHGFQRSQISTCCEKYGLLCMSGPRALESVMMWTHYAESHKGIAIGINDSSKSLAGRSMLRPVKYVPIDEFAKYPIGERVFVKPDAWSYEDERRSFELLEPDAKGADQLVELAEGDISEIVIGCRSDWAFLDSIRGTIGGRTRIRQAVVLPSGTMDVIPATWMALATMHQILREQEDEFRKEIEQRDRERLSQIKVGNSNTNSDNASS